MQEQLQLTTDERVTVLGSTPEALVVEVVYVPAGSPPPAHEHPAQDERFTVLDGEVTVRIAGERRTAGPGDVIEVPRGTPHQFSNASDAPARLRWETNPPGRTLEWFRALDAATARADGRPNIRDFAVLLTEYDDVLRLAVPLRPLVYAALRLIAATRRPARRRPTPVGSTS